MTMTKEQVRQLFEEAKENTRRRSECKQHSFPAFERKLGQRFICASCGCNADLMYVATYAAGFKAAGGDPNSIIPGYEPKEQQS